MLRYILFSFVFFLFFQNSFSQKVTGKPLKELDEVASAIMPKQDNEKLKEIELSLRTKNRAAKFAVPMEVSISPSSNGTWESLNDHQSIWRMRISSPGAKSLNFGFGKYIMPKSAKLRIRDLNNDELYGPYNSLDNEEHEQLWTPIIATDRVMLELEIANNQISELELQLDFVNHDYIGVGQVISGSCNIDVACGAADGFPEVDNYRDIIRSVGMYTISGNEICTGFLVNNTSLDCRPLFITAFHCGVNANNSPALVSYWNYENSTCREPGSSASGNPGDGPRLVFNSGATYRAGYEATDFVLIEFDDPINPDGNTFFAGWDVSENIADAAITIHHPNLEEKRISFENDPLHVGLWSEDEAIVPDGDHLIINDWDLGTTEGGSSGCPLFNLEKRVIGQLHGGRAACGNDLWDSYGWIHSSWNGGGEIQNSLKPWLDPIDIGEEILDGRECSFAIVLSETFVEFCKSEDSLTLNLTISESFEETVEISILDQPQGLEVSLNSIGLIPGSTIDIEISNFEPLEAGIHTISFEASDGVNSSIAVVNINLFVEEIEATLLLEPANQAMNIDNYPLLKWMSDANARSYEIELAEDESFNNLLLSENGLSMNEYSVSEALNRLTKYYWRVRSENPCGEGDWSETFEFTIADIFCGIQLAIDTPLEISALDIGVIFSEINYPFGGSITDIEIRNIRGTHSFLGDLIFSIISPEGTEVRLISEACSFVENFDISFADQALSANPPCPYNDGQTYRPIGSLSDFRGENPRGIWLLRVEDAAHLDGGFLENWEINICTNLANDFSLIPSDTDIRICYNESKNVTIEIGGGFSELVTSSWMSAIQLPDLLEVSQLDPLSINFNPNLNVPVGLYEIQLIVEDDKGNTGSANFTLDILDTPNSVELNFPMDESENIANPINFSWTEDSLISSYIFQLSEQGDFSTILHEQELSVANLELDLELKSLTKYYWRIISKNICGNTNSAEFSFTTDIIDGLSQIEAFNISVSPNPVRNELNLLVNGLPSKDFSLVIYSLEGKPMKSIFIGKESDSMNVNVSDLSNGLYLVKIKNADYSISTKILIQK